MKDYWGKELPVNIGRNNFDELRYEYFRDRRSRCEASRATASTGAPRISAKDWATAYDFPAVREKRVILEEFPIRNSGGMQAFTFNIAARQVPGRAAAPRLQLRLRFRGDEQATLLRPVQAHRQLFRGHRTCVERLAAGRGARDPRDRARQGAAGSVHDALHQSGRRQSPENVRSQPARSDAAASKRQATRSRIASWSIRRRASR